MTSVFLYTFNTGKNTTERRIYIERSAYALLFDVYIKQSSLNLGCNQLITLTVDIDNLNRVIGLQVLAQLGDVNVHTAGVEVVVIGPHSLESKATLQNLVCV